MFLSFWTSLLGFGQRRSRGGRVKRIRLCPLPPNLINQFYHDNLCQLFNQPQSRFDEIFFGHLPSRGVNGNDHLPGGTRVKTILTIGYEHFVLPASVNVNSVLQALSKAEPVESKWTGHKELYRRKPREVAISVKMVPDEDVIEPKKLRAIAEHASPDAHNTFGS